MAERAPPIVLSTLEPGPGDYAMPLVGRPWLECSRVLESRVSRGWKDVVFTGSLSQHSSLDPPHAPCSLDLEQDDNSKLGPFVFSLLLNKIWLDILCDALEASMLMTLVLLSTRSLQILRAAFPTYLYLQSSSMLSYLRHFLPPFGDSVQSLGRHRPCLNH